MLLFQSVGSFALCLGLLTLVAALPAHADPPDVTIGGDARAFAMGGAGIALVQETGGMRYNPASIALERRSFDVRVPSFAVRSRGQVSTNRVLEYFLSRRISNEDLAGSIARDFTRDDSNFGVNANTSIRFGPVEIAATAIGLGRLLPNEALKNFNGGTIPGDARADVISGGYYALPSIGFAVQLPTPASGNRYALGVRLKYLTALYSHYIADSRVLSGSISNAALAPEMNGNDVLQKRGFAADLGLLMQPKGTTGLSLAFVASNLINPNFRFDATDRNGDPTTVEMLATVTSLGAAYTIGGLSIATDLVDILGTGGSRQFRSGAEFALGGRNGIAVRGGYSSATGFTYGFGLGGFDVALGQRQPLEVVRTIKL